MRLIGNKTKLLPEIEAVLAERGVRSGRLLDVFAGSGAVSRHFRGLGFQVHGNDLLHSSYVRQKTYLGLSRPPRRLPRQDPELRRFLASPAGERALAGTDPGGLGQGWREVLAFLNHGLAPAVGLFARQYSEGGPAGRLFFSAENGARIDAIQARLLSWRRERSLSASGFLLVLTSLLEAADRVANISGTYGAFLKKLQHSARQPLRLQPPRLESAGPAGSASREDANRLVRRAPTDVLYIDPPYNGRQYAKNYHVLEVLAELHTVADPAAYEAEIYGVTGLLAFEDRLSDYCRRRARGGRASCREVFQDLVQNARAEHLLVSYSEEGILGKEEIGEALARATGRRHFDYGRDFVEVAYKRFRSDKDQAGRSYRVLAGRGKDEVREWLFYARKAPAARPRRSAAAWPREG